MCIYKSNITSILITFSLFSSERIHLTNKSRNSSCHCTIIIYNEKQNSSLYSPTEIKSFVQTHSPGLWKNLLSAITNYRAPLTTNRNDLQQKRMVALLHILAYFRYDTYFIKDKHTSLLFFTLQHGTFLNDCLNQPLKGEIEAMAAL